MVTQSANIDVHKVLQKQLISRVRMDALIKTAAFASAGYTMACFFINTTAKINRSTHSRVISHLFVSMAATLILGMGALATEFSKRHARNEVNKNVTADNAAPMLEVGQDKDTDIPLKIADKRHSMFHYTQTDTCQRQSLQAFSGAVAGASVALLLANTQLVNNALWKAVVGALAVFAMVSSIMTPLSPPLEATESATLLRNAQ